MTLLDRKKKCPNQIIYSVLPTSLNGFPPGYMQYPLPLGGACYIYDFPTNNDKFNLFLPRLRQLGTPTPILHFPKSCQIELSKPSTKYTILHMILCPFCPNFAFPFHFSPRLHKKASQVFLPLQELHQTCPLSFWVPQSSISFAPQSHKSILVSSESLL